MPNFFNPQQQQQLMQQMFSGTGGTPPMQVPQGGGGVGDGGVSLGPSFQGPEMGMGSANGVEPPDQFNLPVPNAGDPMSTGGRPFNLNDSMANMPNYAPQGGIPSDLQAGMVNGNDLSQLGQGLPDAARQRLIDAIMNRQMMM